MASNRVSSILAADFGSVQTRVVLFDVVDGEYRLVSHAAGRTTLGYPDDDLNVGLRRLLTDMSKVTGRNFYNQMGRVVTPEDRNRNGVDFFVTTASAGRPIRAILVGLVPEISVTSALRAMSGTYIETVAEFHLRDGLSEEDRLNAILLGRPDLIFIAGGTDGGAISALEPILNVIALGLDIQNRDLRPPVLYAGNNKLHEHIHNLFDDLTDVLISDNIRPSMTNEALDLAQVALGRAYDDHRETVGAAFGTVGEMSSTGLLPTAQSYSLVSEYFAKTLNRNVIAIDMGSTSSILAASFNGETNTSISTTKGLGQSAITLVNEVGEDEIARWLPYYPKGSEIRNYALNKLSRPGSIPMSLRDMFMEQALMRTAIRQMVDTARKTWKDVPPAGALPPLDLVVIGGGALNGTGNAAYDMMMIADCLQPTGITRIKADRHGIIPPMSAIARAQSDAAVHILEGNSLEHLGTLISLEGTASGDGIAADLVINIDDETIKPSLKQGTLLTIGIPASIEISIKINCKRGFRVNGKRSIKLTLTGGTGGIVIDGRGRTFTAPASVEDRMKVLPQWISGATDEEAFALPEEWAIDTNEPVVETKQQSEEELFDLQPEPQGDIFADVGDSDFEQEEEEVDLDELFGEEEFEDEPDDEDDPLRGLFD